MNLPETLSGVRARRIAQFLEAHQDHDAGFDVGREHGAAAGRLKVTCLQCGESIEYRAGEAAEQFSKVLEAGLGEGESGASGQRANGGRPPRGWHPTGWLSSIPPRAYLVGLGLLIVAGLLLVATGLIGGQGTNGKHEATPGATPTASTSTPSVAAPAPTPTRKPPPAPRLQARTFAGQYRIGVPRGWRTAPKDTGIALTPPGAAVELDVYFEVGERPLTDLARSAQRFLRSRHPRLQIAAPRPERIGDLRALRVSATYHGGSESAVVLVNAGVTYLLLERVDSDAPARRAREIAAEVASFRPL